MNGLYINLDERQDREKHINNLKNKYDFFKNMVREPAVKKNIGYYGCTLSHINCLEKLKTSPDKYVMVMEDDLTIRDPDNFKLFISDFENIKDTDMWDVIVMTPRGETVCDVSYNFKKIIKTQTATCYIIKTEFIPRVLESLYESKTRIENGVRQGLAALDVVWKPLQLESNFLYYSKLFASQVAQYSSIEKKHINYHSIFLSQYKR